MTLTLDNAKHRRRRAKTSEGAIRSPVDVDKNDGTSPAVSPKRWRWRCRIWWKLPSCAGYRGVGCCFGTVFVFISGPYPPAL